MIGPASIRCSALDQSLYGQGGRVMEEDGRWQLLQTTCRKYPQRDLRQQSIRRGARLTKH